jgi:glycosyltransferase involved in cell wall biosynthesis
MYSDKAPERYSGAHYRPWKRSVKLADMVIVGSSYLAELAKRYNSNVKIISTAVQIEDYRVDSPIQSDGKIRLVWIGSKSSTSYLAEIVPVLEKIGASFNNVVLRIISDEFLDLKNMLVEKVLWEKRSRGIKLAECDIGIAPLPDNPFTQGKCSFKVLEYMASGLPIVASPIGTNKDHIREGITGFLVEKHDQWLEKISLLVRTPQLRTSMGMQGRQFAQQFDVTAIGKRLAEIIKKCLAGTS